MIYTNYFTAVCQVQLFNINKLMTLFLSISSLNELILYFKDMINYVFCKRM